MAINFPNSPTPNQIYTYNGISWKWNGSYWQDYSIFNVGIGFNEVDIIGTTQFTSTNLQVLNFSGVNINIFSASSNTLVFSAATGSTGTSTDGGGFSAVSINTVQQFNSSTSQTLNFSGINITIISAATNTLVLSAGTGGGGGGVTSITTGAGLSANSTTGAITIQATATTTFGVSVDGSGGVITTGQKGYVRIPYNFTITSWTLIGFPSGSITFDIWRVNNAIPTVANTIIGVGGIKPSLTSSTYATSSTLTNWTATGLTGDVIGWNVDSATTTTTATLQLFVTRTS